MICLAIKNPRIVFSEDVGLTLGVWLVFHPKIDTILAYCSTEQEARAFVRAIDGLVDAMYRDAIDSRLSGEIPIMRDRDDAAPKVVIEPEITRLIKRR